ncbi:MAG: Ig-like domain-containing protein, partial [Candidatus Korarchaeota archaeon]|nr:Ig-like domain-containing protein [Thermoproteota archaeon]
YGLYKITIIVYDRGKNTTTSTIFVKTIDVKPPILKILNPKNNSAIRKLSFILQLVVEDDSEVSHIEVFLNGTLYENYTALPGQNNVTVSFNITLAQYGSYEIIIKAYDRNLNRSTSAVFVEAVGPNVGAFIIGIGVLVLLAIACLAIVIAKRK